MTEPYSTQITRKILAQQKGSSMATETGWPEDKFRSPVEVVDGGSEVVDRPPDESQASPPDTQAPPRELTKEERNKALTKAYGEATTALRKRHQEEFDGFYQSYAQAHGVDWQPKPSKAQKAEEEIARLLDENPQLAASLAKKLADRA